MADPSFPFEIGRREGRLTRPIMCRSCALWTAFDGEQWRHPDGTTACVQPDQLHNREATAMNNTTTKAPLVEDGELTDAGKAAHQAVLEAIKAPVKKRSAPKGMTEAQQAEFDRAQREKSAAKAPAPKRMPPEFATACELVPPVGQPFRTPQERTDLTLVVKRAFAYANATGIEPESIDLIASYNTYINNTESRKPMASNTPKKVRQAPAPKRESGLLTLDRSKGRVPLELVTAAVAKALAEDPDDLSAARREQIADGLRAEGYIVNGKVIVWAEMKRQHAKPAEKPAKAKQAKAVKVERNLTRAKVTPIPKAKRKVAV